MNIMKILSLAMTFYSLNKGQTKAAQIILKEAMDVLNTLGTAMKDKKITMVEKKALVKELREFTKATITAIDDIIIPE